MKLSVIGAGYVGLTTAALIVTEWDEFKQVDWAWLLSIVEQPLIIDGRNVFSPDEIRRNGFRYVSMGREGVWLRKCTGVGHDNSFSLRPDSIYAVSA